MAIGSLDDLARVPGMPSMPTIRKIIRQNPDFPIISWGGRGKRYAVDLDEAAAFIRRALAGQIANPAARARWAAEHGLDFAGGGDG